MLKKLIWFWNLVHFNVFIWRNKASQILLSPFFKLLGTQKIKKIYAKRGVSDPDLIVKDAILNPNSGSNSIRAGGTMGLLLFFICVSFFNIYNALFETSININPVQILIYGIIIIPLNYFMLFKEKKYLTYFEEFSTLSKQKRSLYSWICFGFILIVISFFIGSFMFMINLLYNKN